MPVTVGGVDLRGTISLGNALTILAMIVAAAGMWATMEANNVRRDDEILRLAAEQQKFEARQQAMQEANRMQFEAMTIRVRAAEMNYAELRVEYRNISASLRRIEQWIDAQGGVPQRRENLP